MLRNVFSPKTRLDKSSLGGTIPHKCLFLQDWIGLTSHVNALQPWTSSVLPKATNCKAFLVNINVGFDLNPAFISVALIIWINLSPHPHVLCTNRHGMQNLPQYLGSVLAQFRGCRLPQSLFFKDRAPHTWEPLLLFTEVLVSCNPWCQNRVQNTFKQHYFGHVYGWPCECLFLSISRHTTFPLNGFFNGGFHDICWKWL